MTHVAMLARGRMCPLLCASVRRGTPFLEVCIISPVRKASATGLECMEHTSICCITCPSRPPC